MSLEEKPPEGHEHEDASMLLKHLKASEEKFRTAFDQSIMGMVLSDENGVVLSANAAFCRIVGRTEAEVVGRNSEHMTHPDDQLQNVEQLTRIKAGQQSSTTFQKRYVLKDGRIVWTQINVSSLPRVEGEEGALVVTIEDITAQVQARKALQESEQHLRLILESVRDYAIMTVDVEGRVTEWNSGSQRVFGYSAAEILGKDSTVLWTPEDQAAGAPARERQHALNHDGWEGERWLQRKDGSRFFASGRLRPMRDEQGHLIGFSKVCQDITQQHESVVELAKARAKIAETLESERQRLADIFKRSPSFMAVLLGPNHVFDMANDEYYQVVGHRELIGKPIREAMPEIEGQGFFELLDHVFSSGETFHATDVPIVLQRTSDAPPEKRFVDFVYLATRDAEDQITGVFVHGVDQTHRRTAEQALTVVAEQRRVALDAAGMGWWNLNVITGEVHWDDQVKRILGLDANTIELDAVLEVIEPVDRETIRESIRASLNVDDPQPYSVEYRVRHSDGSVHWVQSRGRAYFASEPTRHATTLVGTAVDITEIKLAQDTLRESEARFRQMADAMPQIVFMAQPDGHVDYFNAKWYDYTGFDAYTDTGIEHWRHAHNEDGFNRASIAWPESIRTGNPYEIEYQLRRQDGEFRWHLGRALPIRNEKGEVIRWFGTNTDIHDYKQLQQENEHLLLSERSAREEAERANRIKDEFLATLSHELRTPLSAILGWCTILSNEPDPEDYANGLEIIERNARAQAQIIDDLLDMSAIISGKVRLNVQSTDLAPVVRTAVETLRPTADAKGVRLQSVLDPLARPVSGDPNRLQQIFWNLLSNAIKFTPKGGRVQVLLERVNSHLEVSISDTGEGIAPDFLPLVFDRFRQADASITRRHGGLGLGLAIVKQLVELHGGSVRVKSVGLGFGSTFTVSLPLTAVHTDPPPNETRRHPQTGSGTGAAPAIPASVLNLENVKVLVVDDETDARALICRFLKDQKALVSMAGSVNEAMAILETIVPDVLISDIGMPGEDGYSLIRRVRVLPVEKGGAVPAIALTAYARSEDRMRAIVAGFQMHIAKPAEAAELLAMVASLAGRMQPGETPK
ncbi:PAS domain-containing hybrid sensor histidine kinase/response regulator [Phragmitibacter flavus]|nr:PAS domain S-box protein [Phragmitibacter flavus]